MNILVIGNGFDIASHFPTRYIDFLNFINNSKTLYDNFFPAIHQRVENAMPKRYEELENPNVYMGFDWDGIDSIFKTVRKECRQLFLQIAHSFSISDSELAETVFGNREFRLYNAKLLWLFTRGNVWIRYFTNKKDVLGNNWIDIEQEMQDVILHLIDSGNSSDKRSYMEALGLEINLQPDEIFDILYDNFLQLKDYLEVYFVIMDQAGELAKSKIFTLLKTECPDMESLSPDKIISLNHTHIYQYLYENASCISYPHGEVGKHNLVLGIADEAVPANSKYVRFTKHCQISEYHISQDYQEWVNCDDEDFFEVTIFGSSVSLIDKGLFGYLLSHPAMKKCTVYFGHNEAGIRDNIKNIIQSDLSDEKFIFYGCCE